MAVTNIVLGALLWLLIIVFIGPIILPFFILRKFVNLLARLFNSSLKPLGKFDHVHASAHCRNNNGYILISCLTIDGLIDLTEFQNHFSAIFLQGDQMYDVFYQYIVSFFGYLFKKQVDTIDVKFHIREFVHKEIVNFDELLNDIANSQEDFSRLKGRPSWEIMIIKDISKNQSIVLLKLDHGLVDGYSLIHIIDKLTGSQSPYMVKENKDSESSWKKIKTILELPVKYIKHAQSTKISTPLKNQLELLGVSAASKRPTKHFTSTTTLDLSTVKYIRAKTGARVMPILIYAHVKAIENAMRRFGNRPLRPFNMTYAMGLPRHPAIFDGKICNHLNTGCATIASDQGEDKDSDGWERFRKLQNDFQAFEDNKVDQVYPHYTAPLMRYFPNILIALKDRAEHERSAISFNMSGLSTLILSSKEYLLLGKTVSNINFTGNFHPDRSSSRGVQLNMFTRGNNIETVARASNHIFQTQEEWDYYLKSAFPEELQIMKKSCEFSQGFIC